MRGPGISAGMPGRRMDDENERERLARLERAAAPESPIPPVEQARAVLRMLDRPGLLPEPVQAALDGRPGAPPR